MDKIVDKLYLGNLKGASDLQALQRAGITHILQVASGIRPFFPKDFKYKVISITDTSQSSLIRHFPAACQFIKEGISKGGVLVHCYAGVSRSASCVIAFLMQDRDMTFTEAFAFASKRRPIIFPNMGFQRQLCEYEKLLHLHKSYSSPTRINKQTAKQINRGSSSSIQRQSNHGGSHSMNATVANYTGQSGLVGKNGANKEILKQVHKSLLTGIQPTNANTFAYNSSAQDFLFDQEVSKNDEYDRVKYFDRSNAFGFEDDKLGRLAEINKNQLDSALRDLNSFRRTDQGFNRQPYVRGGISHKQSGSKIYINKVSNASLHRQKPEKPAGKKSFNAGHLKLDKQATSAEKSISEPARNGTIQHQKEIGSPIGKVAVKNVGFNEYTHNQRADKTNNIFANGTRPKTNQSLRKPFRQPTGSFDNTITSVGATSKFPASGDPSYNGIHIQSGSLLQISSEDLHKRSTRGTGAIPDSPLINKKVSQDAFRSVSNNSRHLFVCVGCNTPLFTSKDIIDHDTNTATTSSSVQRNNPCRCNNFFVKQREWMQVSQDPMKKSSGALVCYRKVCRKKLGQFTLEGQRCNCGHFVKPAFAIARNRVKPVTSTSNITMNFGGHNQASNSDLSKYSTGLDQFQTQHTVPSVVQTPDIRSKNLDSFVSKQLGSSSVEGKQVPIHSYLGEGSQEVQKQKLDAQLIGKFKRKEQSLAQYRKLDEIAVGIGPQKMFYTWGKKKS